MEFSIGHLLNFGPRGDLRFWFQNFSIGNDVSYSANSYGFLPFAFSGSVVSLKGDNIDAALNESNQAGTSLRLIPHQATARMLAAATRSVKLALEIFLRGPTGGASSTILDSCSGPCIFVVSIGGIPLPGDRGSFDASPTRVGLKNSRGVANL